MERRTLRRWSRVASLPSALHCRKASCRVSGTWVGVSGGVRCQGLGGVRCQVHQMSGARCQVPGVRCQVSGGVRCQVSGGVRCQGEAGAHLGLHVQPDESGLRQAGLREVHQ